MRAALARAAAMWPVLAIAAVVLPIALVVSALRAGRRSRVAYLALVVYAIGVTIWLVRA
jgi:hypothetical protein